MIGNEGVNVEFSFQIKSNQIKFNSSEWKAACEINERATYVCVVELMYGSRGENRTAICMI